MTVKVDLPDLDELKELIDKINTLSYEAGKLKLEIEMSEALTVLTASKLKGDDGKPLSMSFISSTYSKTGINGELVELRNSLFEANVRLEDAKKTYDYVKLLIDIWRTQSANERLVT